MFSKIYWETDLHFFIYNFYSKFTYYILGDFMVDYLYLKDSLHTFSQNYNFLKFFLLEKAF